MSDTFHTTNEIELPFDVDPDDLCQAITTVQKRARTNLCNALDLLDEVLRSREDLRTVARALGVHVESLQPSATWWLTSSSSIEGTHTLVSLSGYPGHGTRFKVCRGSPSTGTSPGVVRLALRRRPR